MTKRVKKATDAFRNGLSVDRSMMTPKEREAFRKNMRNIINSNPVWD
jgi:hypothetical protein